MGDNKNKSRKRRMRALQRQRDRNMSELKHEGYKDNLTEAGSRVTQVTRHR